jgi:nicotinamidase/pyrazinamidase
MRHVPSGRETPTGLHDLLRERGVKRVVIAGLALDYCVKETALDAVGLGYDTVVVRSATAPVEVHVGDGARAEAEMTAAGIELAG